MTTIADAAPPPAPAKGKAVAPGRFSFSVRTSLLVILSLFVAGMISLAVANLVSAWTAMNSAQEMRNNNEVGDIFLSAAGALAAERGVTNTALASPVPVDARVGGQIARLREEADTALRAALDRAEETIIVSARVDHDVFFILAVTQGLSAGSALNVLRKLREELLPQPVVKTPSLMIYGIREQDAGAREFQALLRAADALGGVA